MGDVIAITDGNGNIIAEYNYDEWGNLTAIYTVDNNKELLEIANANPIRYRGYYYDNETGYYYLQSRYYDPSICRFINADDIVITGFSKGIYNGTNPYMYCRNSPINFIDRDGYFAATVASSVALSFLMELLGYAVIGLSVGAIIAGAILVGYIIAAIIESINSNGTTYEKSFSDTSAKKRSSSNKEYQFCYMNKNGKKKTVGKKMTWAQTLTALGVTNTTLDYNITGSINPNSYNNNAQSAKGSNSSCWGIYADSQVAAKTLAVALGYNDAPKGIDGGYRHYHDGKHLIHIWYGNKI